MCIDMTFERREELIRKEEREEGSVERLVSLIQRKVKKSKTLDTIADELETTVDEIRPIYEAVVKSPENTEPRKILELLRQGI